MIMVLEDINVLAVIASAFITVVIGTFWFNAPFLFKRAWLSGIGKTSEQVAAQFSPVKPLAALVGSLFSAFLLAVVIRWAGAATLLEGALVGLLLGLGFSAIMNEIRDLFEGRPGKLTLINVGHDVVVLVVAGAIIGVWQ